MFTSIQEDLSDSIPNYITASCRGTCKSPCHQLFQTLVIPRSRCGHYHLSTGCTHQYECWVQSGVDGSYPSTFSITSVMDMALVRMKSDISCLKPEDTTHHNRPKRQRSLVYSYLIFEVSLKGF